MPPLCLLNDSRHIHGHYCINTHYSLWQSCQGPQNNLFAWVICGHEDTYYERQTSACLPAVKHTLADWCNEHLAGVGQHRHLLLAEFTELFACPAEFLNPSLQESLASAERWKDICVSTWITGSLKRKKRIIFFALSFGVTQTLAVNLLTHFKRCVQFRNVLRLLWGWQWNFYLFPHFFDLVNILTHRSTLNTNPLCIVVMCGVYTSQWT